MASKKPRFFCDNCGVEVPFMAKNCPGCGRFFASVRCPSCGFSGEEASFKKGCPACHYSASPNGSRFQKAYPERKRTIEALPLWVFIFTAAAFTAVLAALFMVLTK